MYTRILALIFWLNLIAALWVTEFNLLETDLVWMKILSASIALLATLLITGESGKKPVYKIHK